MNIDEMIAVLTAYKNGEEIEWCNAGRDDWSLVAKQTVNSPNRFDSMHYDYRVVEKPKLRPYKNAEEFFEAQEKHGFYIHFGRDLYLAPLSVNRFDKELKLSFNVPAYDEVSATELMKYKWKDDSPCGVLEQNTKIL